MHVVRPAAAAAAAFLGLALGLLGGTASSAASGAPGTPVAPSTAQKRFLGPVVYAHRGLRRTPRRTPSPRSTGPCGWASPGSRTTSSGPGTASSW